MTTTPIYAGLLALMFIVLSVRVIGTRRSVRVGLGDGGSRTLLRRLRVHANFAEYVPLALILMALAELQDISHWILHAIGALLLAGRAAHAYGVGREPEPTGGRVLGMALTFVALATAALCNLVLPYAASFAGGS